MKYSIIIPIFKERKNISQLVLKLTSALKLNKKKFEIIFVDDDSNDGSINEFNKIKRDNIRFYIRTKKPRDLSKSVVYGLNKSKFNNLVVMDGDLQHRPNDLVKLMNIYEKKNFDLVIGSRKMNNYRETNLNPLRFYVSKLLNFITNLLFDYRLKDPMSGFFIINKKVFFKLKNKLFLLGYKILLDIITSSQKKIIFKEVYINFKSREKGFSKMRLKILIQLIIFLIYKFITKK